MYHILGHQIIGGKYSNWIIILQDFYLDFVSSKSKKSLAFTELMFELSRADEEPMDNDSFTNEFLFLIDSSDPCYGDFLVYLHTQHFFPQLSHDEYRCIRHQARHYIIVDDTLYRRGVHLILRCFLIHEETQ
jgi:hypothetical protein